MKGEGEPFTRLSRVETRIARPGKRSANTRSRSTTNFRLLYS